MELKVLLFIYLVLIHLRNAVQDLATGSLASALPPLVSFRVRYICSSSKLLKILVVLLSVG